MTLGVDVLALRVWLAGWLVGWLAGWQADLLVFDVALYGNIRSKQYLKIVANKSANAMGIKACMVRRTFLVLLV